MQSDTRDLSEMETWLQPLADPDAPCGPDLEYDDAYLELMRLAQGKPETQFGPGEPPDWREVRDKSQALMERTRDLRVALLWLRAGVNRTGFSALSPGLRLVHGLLSNFPAHLHPLPDPDDGDQYARANALAMLPQLDGLLGDLRQSVLFSLRGAGELRVRSIAVALGQLPAKAEETPFTRDQLTQMIVSAIEQNPEFADQPRAALAELQSLERSMDESLGASSVPDLGPISDLIKMVLSVMPVSNDASATDTGDAAQDGSFARSDASGGSRQGAALGSVMSRDDALRAIDMVCDYLDRTEPTNPAQLLLRRARRMVNHNFLQLIKELAPEALNEAARVMGVDPETVSLD